MSSSGGTASKPKTISFETIEPRYYPEWGLRPNTTCFPTNLNFMFINGGMGDYVTWMQTIRWLASEATWIKGNLIHPVYLSPLVDYWLKPFPEWTHITYKVLQEVVSYRNSPCRGPIELMRESLNATGAHLSTCGWVYFANKECAPEGIDRVASEVVGYPMPWDAYPQFRQTDLDNEPLPSEALSLEPKKYAVITTGLTTNSRRVPPGAWNHVIEHVLDMGLTPVFLGKAVVETGNATNIHTRFENTLRVDLGLNLIDKTTLLQAASIMSRAAVVIGHDNGLLHLAGSTRDVPIVFGYNLASPKHREPKRPHLENNGMYNVLLTKEELACNFCQSNMNFIIGQNFRECMYGDNLCMTKLFENKAERWKIKVNEAVTNGTKFKRSSEVVG